MNVILTLFLIGIAASFCGAVYGLGLLAFSILKDGGTRSCIYSRQQKICAGIKADLKKRAM